MGVDTSAVCRVLGSMRFTDVPTRWQSVIGLMLPMLFASLRGNATRSSLQMGTSSAEYVNLYDFFDVWMSMLISSWDFLIRTGETLLRKSTNFSAWFRCEKKKS